MSPHAPTRRRTAAAAITATALITPLLVAAPAMADGCALLGAKEKDHANCNLIVHKPGAGGGGGTGGGGNSGPTMPPPPEGLTPDEAQGVIQVPGAPAPAPAPTTTADLLAMAKATTVFPKVVVHTAPKGKTYVGLRTSLWVEGFERVETTPITLDQQTVKLTAKPKSVTWNLGEVKDFPCKDAGNADRGTCNYTYKKSSASAAGGIYQISATITWEVAWSCEGVNCDTGGAQLADNPIASADTPLAVGEIQTNTGQ